MRARAFFESHPVFTPDEFQSAVGGGSRQAMLNLLHYHTREGHIVHLSRGLYATHAGAGDPYAVAGHAFPDAIVGYHAALQFRGCAYSIWRRYEVLTTAIRAPLVVGEHELVPVRLPSRLRVRADLGGFITAERLGVGTTVRVTSYERSAVDVLDAPELGGGWEEIWRSLALVPFLDIDAVIAYTRVLGVALTTARVGYYLEQHRERLMVEEQHLSALERQIPRQVRYFSRGQRGGILARRWRLLVPTEIAEAAWEEPS